MPSIESRSRRELHTLVEATKAYSQCLVYDKLCSVNGKPVDIELDMSINEGYFAVTIGPDSELNLHSAPTKFRVQKTNEGHSLFEVLGCTTVKVTDTEGNTHKLEPNALYQIPFSLIQSIRTTSMGGFDLDINVTENPENNHPVLQVNRRQFSE